MIAGRENTSTGRHRAAGFRDALAEAGVAIHPAACREVEYTHADGHSALLELLDSPQAPTGLFCANDVLAIGALNAAKKRGVRIPEDLSIIGYDDMTMSAWECFDLTTVRQDIETIASTAGELLLDRIGGYTDGPRRVVVESRLMIRSTDGPPAS